MTVQELIDLLRRAPPDGTVYVATPVPTEMKDCEATGLTFEQGLGVWIDWATENAGSGMTLGDTLTATREGLR